MAADLFIQNGTKIYTPSIEEGIVWQTDRSGSPGKLTFKILNDKKMNFEEGNPVRFEWNGKKIFYGYVFTKQSDKTDIISVTAYDQLRYFKNKDTYVYENKTAGQLIKMIAKDYNLQTGSIADTKYNIASRVEDNQTLFDIVQNALDLTLTNRKELYIMYDDFGKITLKALADMKLNLLIDEETGENYSYTSTIDEQTYNKIKLVYDNEDTGQRDVYIAKHSKNINKWGLLQYYDTLQEGENGQQKADALLNMYNVKTRKLSITNAFGDVRVRAGSMPVIQLNLGDVQLQNYMLVESCKHTFKNDEHMMDLTMTGGEFVA